MPKRKRWSSNPAGFICFVFRDTMSSLHLQFANVSKSSLHLQICGLFSTELVDGLRVTYSPRTQNYDSLILKFRWFCRVALIYQKWYKLRTTTAIISEAQKNTKTWTLSDSHFFRSVSLKNLTSPEVHNRIIPLKSSRITHGEKNMCRKMAWQSTYIYIYHIYIYI